MEGRGLLSSSSLDTEEWEMHPVDDECMPLGRRLSFMRRGRQPEAGYCSGGRQYALCAMCTATVLLALLIVLAFLRPSPFPAHPPDGHNVLPLPPTAFAASPLPSSNDRDTETVHLSLDVQGGQAVSYVRDEYVSYTVDTSRDRNFFNTSFADPRLRQLAGLLQPAIVRIGGTGNDFLVYQVGQESNCVPGTGEGWRGFVRECLNMTHWDDLAGFVQVAGARLVFGLNVLYPLAPLDERPLGTRVWNSSNARALLEHCIATGIDIYGLELGNEENLRFSPEQNAAFLGQLADMLEELYPDAAKRPKLIAPDPHSYIFRAPSEATNYLGRFLDRAKQHITAVAYHEYVGVEDEASSLNASVLDTGLANGLIVANATALHAPKAEVWVGESANKNRGGGNWGFTFGAALWYVDALGLKASIGHTLHLRQDFVGASYALVGPGGKPRLGFYTAMLAKRLLGRGVLAATRTGPASGSRHARSYTFCQRNSTQGGVVVLLVNLELRATLQVNVTIDGRQQIRHEYHLTAPSLASGFMLLNGKVHLGPGEINAVPVHVPQAPTQPDPASSVLVAPASFAFIVYPDAQSPACMQQ